MSVHMKGLNGCKDNDEGKFEETLKLITFG